MDNFLLSLHSEGFVAPKVAHSQLKDTECNKPMSKPHIVSYLEQRKPSVFKVALQLTARPCKPPMGTCWSIQNETLEDNHVLDASNDFASDVILNLSDDLGAPGSYVLNVIWDMRGIKTDCIKNFTGIFGAIKKLCKWHMGRLHVYAQQRALDSFGKCIMFMDPYAVVVGLDNDSCITFDLRKDIIWRGSLDILQEDVSHRQIHGMTLLKDSLPRLEILVNGRARNDNNSFLNEPMAHVWIEPRMRLLSYVDITTVPLFYFSGRRFFLEYHVDADRQLDSVAIQKMCDAVSSSEVGAFLCCLKYVISRHNFEPVPGCKSVNWKQAILNDPSEINAQKSTLLPEIQTLHILLRQSHSCLSESVQEGSIRFIAHILHDPEELNFRSLLQCESSSIRRNEEWLTLDVKDLPPLNPHGLLHKEREFHGRIARVLRQLSGRDQFGSIPVVHLEGLVSDTLQQLDREQESLLLDVSCLPRLGLDLDAKTKRESSHDRQKEVLINLGKFTTKWQSGLGPLKPSCLLRRSNSSPMLPDMHFKPENVLEHFNINGEPRDGVVIIRPSHRVFDFPGEEKLKSFEDSVHISHHGITFNLDEQAKEKFDRMCHRLVQRQVKYETSSLGSTEKVPSPASNNILTCSPILQSSEVYRTSHGSKSFKRVQLKKVAEKLYQKRIRTQRSVEPRITQSTMLLRSTPKKTRPKLSSTVSEGRRVTVTKKMKSFVEKKSCVQDLIEVSVDEEKRNKHRTYVQDNKRRLQNMVAQALVENGVPKGSKNFQLFSRRLFNVSMEFLRDLKSSKDLDRIMKSTVYNNAHLVISFKTK